MISCMPGPQDLDHDLLAALQPRRVHLRDGGRGERRLLEARERARRAAGRSACSMAATATALSNGGTRSCSFASSSAMSAGSRSRRVETAWPNLTKIGPSSSSASRRRSPRVDAGAALKPGPRREIEQEAERAVQMRGAHEIVEAVAHQRALDLEQAGGDPQPHHAGVVPFSRCSSRARRASTRSAVSRSASTPRRNSSTSGLRDQIAAFFLKIFGDVLAGGARRACAPSRAPPCAASGEAPRRQIADEPRQLLLRDRAGRARSSSR